ncbi:hypothetical protein [Candidatus Nitrosocosmicus sp. R]
MYNVDVQEEAVNVKLNHLKNVDITQDIFTAIYDGRIGYTFVVLDPTSQTKQSFTFVGTKDHLYNIHISGMSYNPNTTDNMNKILNSIKFFD